MGAFETKVYNAGEMTIVLGPVLITDGFADGEFLRIEQETDDFSDVVGSSGEVAVSRTEDRRATVTIILLQTALANGLLSAIANLGRNTPNGAGAFLPFFANDQNGQAIFTAQNAWIMKPPDASFDRTAQSREWPIRCSNLVRFDGGNNNAA